MNWNAYYPDERRLRRAGQLPPGLHRRQHPPGGRRHDPAHGRRWCSSAWSLGLAHRAAARPQVPGPRHRPHDDDHAVPHRPGGRRAALEARALQPGVRPVQRRCCKIGSSVENAPQPDWITNNPLWAIIAALVWQWTPFMMLILLAGLQSRPLDVVEAASIDGATSWQIFSEHDAAAPAPVHRAVRRCSGRSTSCRTSTPSSPSPPAVSAPRTCPTSSTRPSTPPRTTAGPPPPASSWSSARSSSRRRAAHRVQPVQGGVPMSIASPPAPPTPRGHAPRGPEAHPAPQASRAARILLQRLGVDHRHPLRPAGPVDGAHVPPHRSRTRPRTRRTFRAALARGLPDVLRRRARGRRCSTR